MFTFFKNFFGESPKKGLTDEQIRVLNDQATKYYHDLAELSVKMAFEPSIDVQDEIYIKKIMITHRIAQIKKKLFKDCKCEIDHSKKIEELECAKEIYLKFLLKQTDELNDENS